MSPDWQDYFLGMARHVATKSKDPSTKVGAVLVDANNRVVSIGFNGPPRGVPDDPSVDRETKLRRTLHAEQNAIIFARRDLAGCTLYVTHAPCARCAAMIVQTGITRVVYFAPEPEFEARWADDLEETRFMFLAAGVEVGSVLDDTEVHTYAYR